MCEFFISLSFGGFHLGILAPHHSRFFYLIIGGILVRSLSFFFFKVSTIPLLDDSFEPGYRGANHG